MRLWLGFREERGVAVATPMPEEPPVMGMVLGENWRDVREEMEGRTRDMVVVVVQTRWSTVMGYAWWSLKW